MWLSCLNVHLWTTCVLCNPQSPKGIRMLRTELQIVVSCHIGAENRTWVFGKSSLGSEALSHLSNMIFNILFKHTSAWDLLISLLGTVPSEEKKSILRFLFTKKSWVQVPAPGVGLKSNQILTWALCHHCCGVSCKQDSIIDQRDGECVGVYVSPLAACRVCLEPKMLVSMGGGSMFLKAEFTINIFIYHHRVKIDLYGFNS